MKEFHPIRSLIDFDLARLMQIETLVFSRIKGGQVDRILGVKVNIGSDERDHGREGTSLIDLDELPELLEGLKYLNDKYALLLAANITDWTELSYTTNGSFRVGFYLQKDSESEFVNTRVYASCASGDTLIFGREAIGAITTAFEAAQKHLEYLSTPGSAQSNPSMQSNALPPQV